MSGSADRRRIVASALITAAVAGVAGAMWTTRGPRAVEREADARARALIELGRAAVESWPSDAAAWFAEHRGLLMSPALDVAVDGPPADDRRRAEELREWLIASLVEGRYQVGDLDGAADLGGAYLRGRRGAGSSYRLVIAVMVAEARRAALRTAGVIDLLASRPPRLSDPATYVAHWHVTAAQAQLDLGQLGQARVLLDRARRTLDTAAAEGPVDAAWAHADCALREAELDVAFLGGALPEEVIALAEDFVAQYPDGEDGAIARAFRAVARLVSGTDLESAEAELDELFEVVPPQYRLVIAEKCADAALRRGRFGAARRHIARARAVARADGVEHRSRAALYAAELELADPAADRERLVAALGDLEAQCARLLDEWRDLPDLPNGVGFLRDDRNARAFGALAQLALRVDPEHGVGKALEWLWRAQACSSLARAADLPAPSLAALQRGIAPLDAKVVTWLPGRSATLTFVIGPDGVEVVEAAGLTAIREPLLDLDRAVRRSAAADDAADVEVLAHRAALRKALALDRVLAAVGSASRIVVSAPTLEWLPFELFDDPAAPGAWLGESRTIEHISSIPLAVAEQGGSRPLEGPELLAVATLGGAPMLGDLAPARSTLEIALQDRIPAHLSASLLFGARATRGRLLERLGSDPARFLGILHGERPSLAAPGLVIATEDGGTELFDAASLDGLELHGDYVLLACRTARGAPRIGDGPLADTFPGRLLRARVNTVAAAWTVLWADRAVDLAGELLRVWGDDVDLASAMRAARTAAPDAAARLRWNCIQVHGRSWSKPVALRHVVAEGDVRGWHTVVLGSLAALAALTGLAVWIRRGRGASPTAG